MNITFKIDSRSYLLFSVPLFLRYQIGMMTCYKTKQLKFEMDTWKRVLAFMVEENIHMKNRLSEILTDDKTSHILNEIEEYQNKFIKTDELISILRNDVAELEQILFEKFEDPASENRKINNKLGRIRLNIPLAERQIDRMKMDFNRFLLVAIM